MIAPSRHRIASTRRAMTLVEVLLVLALVVILSAIVYPSLTRPMAAQRLRKSADAVRVAWAKARVKAISNDRTYMFRYVEDGGVFMLSYYTEPEFEEEPTEDDSSCLCTSDSRDKLPEGILFVASQTIEDSRSVSIEGDTPLSESFDETWSQPILFYPDGTTSTARLVLRNEYDRAVQLSLRGLTGIASVGDVYSLEESP